MLHARRLASLTSVLLSLFACRGDFDDGGGGGDGDGGGLDQTLVSGERLRATWVENGDVRLFDRWYDAQLDTTCSLVENGDGTVTCVPDSGNATGAATGTIVEEDIDGRVTWKVAVGDDDSWRALIRIHDRERGFDCYAGGPLSEYCAPESTAYIVPGTSYHADSTCMGPEFAYSAGTYDPIAVTELIDAGAACGGFTSRYYEVGAQQPGAAYVSYEAGMCDAAPAEVRLWEKGAEIPGSDLIAVESFDWGEGRMRASLPATGGGVLLSAPGFGTALTDTQLSAACSLIRVSGAGVRCMPTNAIFTQLTALFADPACSEPVISLIPDSCLGIPDWIVLLSEPPADANGNYVIESIHKPGAKFTGEVWSSLGGGCDPIQIGGEEETYRLGDGLAVTQLALFEPRTD